MLTETLPAIMPLRSETEWREYQVAAKRAGKNPRIMIFYDGEVHSFETYISESREQKAHPESAAYAFTMSVRRNNH